MNKKAVKNSLQLPLGLNLADNNLHIDSEWSTFEHCNAPYINNMYMPLYKTVAESEGPTAYDANGVKYTVKDGALFKNDTRLFNHARLGARILFTHGLINDIIPDYDKICEEDRTVMEKAVFHHSDLHLPVDLSDRELLFCKIIREADQLDIFRTIVESGWRINYFCEKEELLKGYISDDIAKAFFDHTMADYSKRVTAADYHMAHIALCFGLESESAKKRAIEQGYLLQMMDIEFVRPEVQEKYQRMKAEVYDFLEM